jgi:molecular chaperone HscB
MNFFELYDIPVTLKPDPTEVKKRFYQLSRQYHPDFFMNASTDEQTAALEKSSMVNKAYRVFQNEDELIKYVLQLNNLIEEEEKYELKPAFLMEVLDINEQLMTAEMDNDAEALSKSEDQANDLLKTINKEVRSIIEHYSDSQTTLKEKLDIKDYYYKKKYLQRILAKIAQMRNIAPRF